jgi:lipopolysaccharide exporter
VTENLSQRVAIGIAWMTSARAGVRILGLLSTLVLARVLVPADFGIVAMATAVAAGLELLTLFGFDVALIQRKELSRDDYDSAWTLNVILGLVVGLGLILISEVAAEFYREPRLDAVLDIFGAKFVLRSAANPGMVDFRRAMQFRQEFYQQILPKFAGLLLTIPLAIVFRSYWALIAGTVFTEFAATLLSYIMHPHRPRPCLTRAHGLFRFSRWLLINSLTSFIRNRGATFIIGRTLGTSPLGIYTLAYEISNLPTTEMVAPINRVLYPTYVRVVDDPVRLRESFTSTLGLIAITTLPASVGIAAVADPLVRVMLGPHWLPAIPLISLLALSGSGNALQTNTGSLQNALGQPHYSTLTGILHLLTLMPLIWFATERFGLPGTAWAYFIHTWTIAIGTTYGIVLNSTPIRTVDVLGACWRPAAASLVMYAAVRGYLTLFSLETAHTPALIAILLSSVALGAVTYLAGVTGLWFLRGRPEGSEAAVWRRIRNLPGLRRLVRH